MIRFPIKSFQDKVCLSPFVMIEVTLDGSVRMCGCGAWLPTVVGNLKENTLASILASDTAREIRQSIIDGTFQYCNEKLCGVIANDGLNDLSTVPPNVKKLLNNAAQFEMPHHISFQGDRTCNLSCPSCRTGIIKTPDEKKEQQAQIGKIISANLFSQASDQRIVLETSGTGELFASELLISFVNGIEKTKFPNFKLHIDTNGLLCPERWHKILDLDNFVEKITVSIDAAYGPTYEQIRRGGHWNDILDAMKFLQNKKHSLGIELHTRMIVQQQNYKEIKDFYNLCQTFDVDVVEYSRLTNWRTWSTSEFQRHDVFIPTHPEFNQAKLAIDSVKSLPGTWFAGL